MSYQISVPLDQLPLGEGNSGAALQRSILDLLGAYMESWENGDYQALKNMSPHFYGMGAEVLQRIELLTYFADIDRGYSDEEDSALTKTMKSLADDDSEEAQATKDAIRAQLEKDLPAGEVEDAFASLMDGSHPLFDAALTRSKTSDRESALLSGQYATLMSFATSSDYLGLLRTGLAEGAVSSLPPQEGDLSVAEGLTHAIKDLNDAGIKAIYDALKEDKDRDTLLGIARKYLEDLQGKFVMAGAYLGAFLPLIPNQANGAEKVKAYKAALGLTVQVQYGLLLHAYCAYIRANLSERSYKRWLSDEQRRTDNRTFSSGAERGTPISIGDLINDGSVEAGTLVQIEGLVTAMEIRDDQAPPKFSTFVTLTDPETDESLVLRAHMFGLEDNGVSVGSYAKVNGHVRREEHWLAEGETGLDIDRINFGEVGKTHWLDNVVDRMDAYYPIFKDSMNMFFTLN